MIQLKFFRNYKDSSPNENISVYCITLIQWRRKKPAPLFQKNSIQFAIKQKHRKWNYHTIPKTIYDKYIKKSYSVVKENRFPCIIRKTSWISYLTTSNQSDRGSPSQTKKARKYKSYQNWKAISQIDFMVFVLAAWSTWKD